MTKAAAQLPSFAHAAFAVDLLGIDVNKRHLQRIAQAIGEELTEQRDQKVEQHRNKQLPVRVAATPEVVAVEVDGGRLRTRQQGCGPGVHQQQNKEDKIACLVTLESEVHRHDPQPEPPESFQMPRRVQRLVAQMRQISGEEPTEEPLAGEDSIEQESACEAEDRSRSERTSPRKKIRTCVASMAQCQSFGPMVAAEAQERDFYRAKRRAFLGDGAKYNWRIHKTYFKEFEPITDFLHVLCYIYSAAQAVGGEQASRWSKYLTWLRACWQGRVGEVIEELRQWQERFGEPPKGAEVDRKDPRQLVKEALGYLENNQSRMDYPRYRREGLPIVSSLVESLVGEFNSRVKSRQKFWNRNSGAESILQLRAAVLSEDDRLERFFEQRPGQPFHKRPKAA